MTMGDKIRQLREQRGLTLEQVGNAVGVGKSTVRKWETGDIANMRRDKIERVARALDVDPGYLMGWQDNPVSNDIPEGFAPMPEMQSVPRIGRIACGSPITAEQNHAGYDQVPANLRADFALECHGDSMLPRIEDGDIVAIRKQAEVETGQIAAVRIDGEATLKRVYRYADRLVLQAENPAYPPIVLLGDEMVCAHIEGLAVGLIRKL